MHHRQVACKGNIADVNDGGCVLDRKFLCEHHSVVSRSHDFEHVSQQE